jgi:hypothetical protein
MFMYGIYMGSRDLGQCSVYTMGWTTKELGVDFWQEEEIFLSFPLSRLLLGHTMSYPVGTRQKKNGSGVKPTTRLLSNAEVKKAWGSTSTTTYGGGAEIFLLFPLSSLL